MISDDAVQTNREILLFLWRWKLVSTAALSARFFPDLVPHSAYKKFLWLAERDLIASICDSYGKKFLWTLTRKGFDVVKNGLPELREAGFKSEYPDHDHLVTAVHLGDDLLRLTPKLETWSEQELRRHDPTFYPKWVPGSSLHRPDGYWKALGGSALDSIALEVELTSKRDADYRGIAKFYARHQNIVRVIWYCPGEAMAKRLHRLLLEPEDSSFNQHSFFLVPDFEKQGWGAVCKVGAGIGNTLRSILIPGEGSIVGNDLEHVPSGLLCDRRKSRTRFEEYYRQRLVQKALLTPPRVAFAKITQKNVMQWEDLLC